ncbi:MAG TPA: hypothetical protein VFO68_02125 [Actinophytocola sp.]|nr:hypothetical protein [Actinophytocola sp.]
MAPKSRSARNSSSAACGSRCVTSARPTRRTTTTRRASRAGVLLDPVTEPPIRRHLVRALAEAATRQASSPGYDAELAHWTGRRTPHTRTASWPPAHHAGALLVLAEPLPESPRRPVHDVIGYLPGMAPRKRQH